MTSAQRERCEQVFFHITLAATEGNKAGLSLLNFYLDEAKRRNAMMDNMMKA